jgi:hypothetical protein
VKRLFCRLALALCFLCKVECSPIGGTGGVNFLSDAEAGSFLEKFLQNHARWDYAFHGRLDAFSKNHATVDANCLILHHRIGDVSSYYVEIQRENSQKFILRDGIVWTNFRENFNPAEPFVEGSLYAPNDLLLPFLGSSTLKYSGPKKVCGRATQQFVAKVDNDSLGEGVKFAKISVDSKFLQILEIEYLDGRQRVMRKHRVLALRKKDDYWLPKTIELFDNVTRERSKITIIDADLNPNLSNALFEPEFHRTRISVK